MGEKGKTGATKGKRERRQTQKGKRESNGDDDFAGFPPDIHSARTHERNETISRLVSPPNLRWIFQGICKEMRVPGDTWK